MFYAQFIKFRSHSPFQKVKNTWESADISHRPGSSTRHWVRHHGTSPSGGWWLPVLCSWVTEPGHTERGHTSLSLWGRVFHFVFPPARAEAAEWQQEAAELVQSAARGAGPVPPWPSATYTQWLPDSEPSYIESQSRDNKLWLHFPSREKVNRRDMSCGGVWWLSSSEGRSVPGHGGQRAGLWPVSTMVRETRHLWVGNLPENLSKERIKEYFNR